MLKSKTKPQLSGLECNTSANYSIPGKQKFLLIFQKDFLFVWKSTSNFHLFFGRFIISEIYALKLQGVIQREQMLGKCPKNIDQMPSKWWTNAEQIRSTVEQMVGQNCDSEYLLGYSTHLPKRGSKPIIALTTPWPNVSIWALKARNFERYSKVIGRWETNLKNNSKSKSLGCSWRSEV